MIPKKDFSHLLLLFGLTIFLLSCSNDSETDSRDESPMNSEDNTPPTLVLNGLVENQTLSESIQLNLEIQDNSNQNILLQVFLDDEEIYRSDTNYTFLLNPDLYVPGEKTMRFVATDNSQNSSSLNIDFNIKRVLVRLTLEENYFRIPIAETFAFVSKTDGEILDSLTLVENEELKLLAPFDFDANEDFTLTLITKNTNGTFSLESIPHVNKEETNSFLLTNEGRFNFETFEIDYSSTGFTELQGLGYGYFVFTPNQQSGSLDLLDRQDPPENIYVLSKGGSVNSQHFYAKVNRNTITDPLVLNLDSFTSENVTVGNFPYSQNSTIGIIGFEDLDDFQSYKFHEALFGLGLIQNQNRILHPYIDNFAFYRHSYTDLIGPDLDGYRYLGEGLPLNSYNPIETDLSSTFNGNTIRIDFTSISNYYSGKIHLKSGNQIANWVFNFDAVNDRELVLPKLPGLVGLEELEDLNYEIKSTRISNYSSIASFSEYLNEVKSRNLRYFAHSSFVEHITIWPSLNDRETFISPLY